MTFTIGENCHLVLTHPDVNGGVGYGFLVNKDNSPRDSGVQITREVVSDTTDASNSTTATQLWFNFDILLANNLVNPDGSIHDKTRAQDYAMLLEYLAQPAGLMLTTPVGAFLDLGALGWSADERHQPAFSIIKCGLNNVGYYFPPVDPALLALSLWDGTLAWDTSYWR
jgi:hypothetical protein